MAQEPRGFTTVELCILLIVTILAFAAIRRPLVSAIAGRWKQTADIFGHGLQYEPGVTH